ncbi:3-oxoacyl-reductase [Armillaria gallica]|uniref:3-oxoacyl-reductase n=1 Tax=Armillaria gallica TaxID=47427 RepID=A0A2H3EEP9_ARMGA|nr:3-oxoacyl-reductase [Armillaria gallica]
MFSVPGIALITGAGSGIGRATALAFARAGASGVHLVDVNRARLEQASKDVSTVATNPGFKSHISETDDTLKTFGRIDYAANIAGITESVLGPTADTSLETYDRVNNLNARGVFLCMREELKAMRAQEPLARIPGRPGVRGSIINMSSIAGCIGLNGVTSYVASKHAVVGMTKAAAISHSVDGIRVNAVCPGYVDTPLLRDIEDFVDFSILEKMTPMNRLALTEEVADVVLFMASERASYVTGHSFVVDGGSSIA